MIHLFVHRIALVTSCLASTLPHVMTSPSPDHGSNPSGATRVMLETDRVKLAAAFSNVQPLENTAEHEGAGTHMHAAHGPSLHAHVNPSSVAQKVRDLKAALAAAAARRELGSVGATLSQPGITEPATTTMTTTARLGPVQTLCYFAAPLRRKKPGATQMRLTTADEVASVTDCAERCLNYQVGGCVCSQRSIARSTQQAAVVIKSGYTHAVIVYFSIQFDTCVMNVYF